MKRNHLLNLVMLASLGLVASTIGAPERIFRLASAKALTPDTTCVVATRQIAVGANVSNHQLRTQSTLSKITITKKQLVERAKTPAGQECVFTFKSVSDKS